MFFVVMFVPAAFWQGRFGIRPCVWLAFDGAVVKGLFLRKTLWVRNIDMIFLTKCVSLSEIPPFGRLVAEEMVGRQRLAVA